MIVRPADAQPGAHGRHVRVPARSQTVACLFHRRHPRVGCRGASAQRASTRVQGGVCRLQIVAREFVRLVKVAVGSLGLLALALGAPRLSSAEHVAHAHKCALERAQEARRLPVLGRGAEGEPPVLNQVPHAEAVGDNRPKPEEAERGVAAVGGGEDGVVEARPRAVREERGLGRTRLGTTLPGAQESKEVAIHAMAARRILHRAHDRLDGFEEGGLLGLVAHLAAPGLYELGRLGGHVARGLGAPVEEGLGLHGLVDTYHLPVELVQAGGQGKLNKGVGAHVEAHDLELAEALELEGPRVVLGDEVGEAHLRVVDALAQARDDAQVPLQAARPDVRLRGVQ
mmetsp:Transcript_10962/g.29731  ORF Transcript_10962/g.29731 Transcript_10962/m.29731 type:complete len:342 (+) Transcript_10962:487-1512(+)